MTTEDDIERRVQIRVNGPRFWERPCAAHGLVSYRFRGRYGFIMIGATDDRDALTQAARSATIPVSLDRLERWNGTAYEPVKIAT